MFGEVISVDATTGDGVILGEDQQSYAFAASACRGRLQPRQKVEFALRDGAAVEIFKLSAARHSLGLKPPAPLEDEPDAVDTPLGYVRNNRGWGQLLWSPDGRIRRGEFWKAFGVITAANVLLGWIPFVGNLVGLVTIWPNIAIQTKRLHDLGRSGWMQLLPYAVWIVIIPLSIVLLSRSSAASAADLPALLAAAAIPLGLALICNLAFFIWIGCVEGQSGSNRFGADPKNPIERTAETFA